MSFSVFVNRDCATIHFSILLLVRVVVSEFSGFLFFLSDCLLQFLFYYLSLVL